MGMRSPDVTDDRGRKLTQTQKKYKGKDKNQPTQKLERTTRKYKLNDS